VQQYTVGQITAANPNLKPEKSHNVTAGFVFDPLPALSLAADYYLIKKTGVIIPSFPGSVFAAYYAGAPLPPGSAVTPDNPDPAFPNLPPRPLAVAAPYINANSEETDGVDCRRAACNWISGRAAGSARRAGPTFSASR